MRKRIVYFFPFSPLPAHSGAARRCAEILWGLRELGSRITVLFVASSGPLDAGQVADELRRAWGVHDVHYYTPGRLDYRLGALFAWLGRSAIASPPYSSPMAQAWFRRRLRESAPDVLLMSYAFCDCLVPKGESPLTKVMDSIDLWSLYSEYHRAAQAQLPSWPIRAADVPEQFLREDYFDRLGLTPSRGEFEAYDRYDTTLAISAKEAAVLRANTRRTRVSYLPMSQEVVELENAHDGDALFVLRAHPFNLQGYCYFVRRVLPLVRVRAPSFRLRVVGDGCRCVSATEGVELAGFVPDLHAVYRTTRFAIVPVFGGTGQQVKLVEAMAHGVPVVAIRQAAEASPLIEHGVNGLVAANAEEFADHVLRLWNDPGLCREMGHLARETVRRDFNRTRLVSGLQEVLA